ncbi:MAG: substrate-binding domain-containing protein [Candidatus Limiplasma sp.]|nr:substrate-binding domain-containing protein [Candidatus Limiplasma sp.]
MRDQMIPVFVDEKSASSSQYANTIQGIRTAAARCNMRLRLISDARFDETDFETLPGVAIVTGVSMPFIQKAIARLRSHGRYAVLAGTDSEQFGHDVSCATPSRRTETQQLVNYLYNCGKRRIALVGFGRRSINDNFRYHAAMSAVAAWGNLLKDEDVWLWEQDPSESFEQFLQVHSRYDAAICPNDVIAVWLVDFLQKNGTRVPDDLFVASFGNMAIGRYHIPSITSMTMDMLVVGEQAFNVWRFLMKNDKSQQTALKMTVPSRLLIRQSTANTCIEAGEGAVAPTLQDHFYHNPTIALLVGIENCINQRDETDLRIMRGMMDGKSYEQISDELFISGSTLRYRLNKIFADIGAHNRQEFETIIRTYLGNGNPFRQS